MGGRRWGEDALVCCAVGEMFCWSMGQAEVEAGRGGALMGDPEVGEVIGKTLSLFLFKWVVKKSCPEQSSLARCFAPEV